MPYENAHAAKIENGVVTQVIVIPFMDDDDAKVTAFCNSIGLTGTWIDTSYTGSRRGKYAAPGDSWDGVEFTSPVVAEPTLDELKAEEVTILRKIADLEGRK
jgi:hypothetical protein